MLTKAAKTKHDKWLTFCTVAHKPMPPCRPKDLDYRREILSALRASFESSR